MLGERDREGLAGKNDYWSNSIIQFCFCHAVGQTSEILYVKNDADDY